MDRIKFYFVSLLVIFLVTSFLYPSKVFARQGCCSYHGGVCGCGCCDGSSLSSTCAPYYPECNRKYVLPVPTSKPIPTPTTKKIFIPTPTLKPISTSKPIFIPTSTPTPKATSTPIPKPTATPIPSNTPTLISTPTLNEIIQPTPTETISQTSVATVTPEKKGETTKKSSLIPSGFRWWKLTPLTTFLGFVFKWK